jgi:hypothetical protein
MSTKEIESRINNLPKQKVPGSDGFTGEFYKILKKEIMSIVKSLFSKIEADGIFPNSFCESKITLTPKADRHYKKRKLKVNISLNIDAKIPIKILQILSSVTLYTVTKWDLPSRYAKLVWHLKINQNDPSYQKIKEGKITQSY